MTRSEFNAVVDAVIDAVGLAVLLLVISLVVGAAAIYEWHLAERSTAYTEGFEDGAKNLESHLRIQGKWPECEE